MLYSFNFDNASFDEISDLLYEIASELQVQRNNSLSLVEKYACDANEGREGLEDALRYIEYQTEFARLYDKTASMVIEAADTLTGCL